MKRAVVLVVLSVLLTPAWSQFGNLRKARAQGQCTACKSNLKNLATACEMYSTDYNARYPKSLDLLTKNSKYGPYLMSIPTCPAAGADTYSATWTVTAPRRNDKGKVVGRDPYNFYCKGHIHKDAGLGPNLPSYHDEGGLIDH